MTSIYRTMSLKKIALAAAFAVSAGGVALAADIPIKAAPKKVKEVPFFFVNDNSISFAWYPKATDPGVWGNSNTIPLGTPGQGNAFSKYYTTFTHFDVWEYGTNFINVDAIKSASQDPIEGIPGATGAMEFYAIGRSTIGLNEISHSKAFSNAITKDVSFEFGGDLNTENNLLAPNVRKIGFGGQITLNLPGVVNLSVLAWKEWNHNFFYSSSFSPAVGFAFNPPGTFTGDTEFHWIPRIEIFIVEPLTFLPPSLPLTWTNVTNVSFPKGTGISPANAAAAGCTLNVPANKACESVTEVYEDNRLSLDMSQVFWSKPGIWDGYVGYKYWYNKFGTNHEVGAVPVLGNGFGSTSVESTAYIGTTYHFK